MLNMSTFINYKFIIASKSLLLKAYFLFKNDLKFNISTLKKLANISKSQFWKLEIWPLNALANLFDEIHRENALDKPFYLPINHYHLWRFTLEILDTSHFLFWYRGRKYYNKNYKKQFENVKEMLCFWYDCIW